MNNFERKDFIPTDDGFYKKGCNKLEIGHYFTIDYQYKNTMEGTTRKSTEIKKFKVFDKIGTKNSMKYKETPFYHESC